MSQLCLLTMRCIAVILSAAVLSVCGKWAIAHDGMVSKDSGLNISSVNPSAEINVDARCGYYAIRMVARLLGCPSGVQEETPADAPALSVAECMEQLQKIGLSVEPTRLEGNIFAAIENGISERGDGCVAIVLFFTPDQRETDIGHYFVCFRSDDEEMLMLDPNVSNVVTFNKISGGPPTCICLFVTNDVQQFIPRQIEKKLGLVCWIGVALAIPFLVARGRLSFWSFIPSVSIVCIGALLQPYFHRMTVAAHAPSTNRQYNVRTITQGNKEEEIVVDIGTHLENEHVDFSMEWTNRFSEPIQMIRLSPSCSCIRLQFDKAPVAPGKLFKGKGTISLTGIGNVEQRLVGSMRLNDGKVREFLVRIQGKTERDLSMDITRTTVGIIRPGIGSEPVPIRWQSNSQTFRFVDFCPKEPGNSVLKVDPITLNEDRLGFDAVFRSDAQSNQLGSFNEKWNLTFENRNGIRVVLSVTVEGLVQNGPIAMPGTLVMFDGRSSVVNLYIPTGLAMTDVVHSVEPAELCHVEIASETPSSEVWSIGKLSCTIPSSGSNELRTGRIVFRDRLTQNEISAIQLYVFPKTLKHEPANSDSQMKNHE